jgi:signal transduction histidine kinase
MDRGEALSLLSANAADDRLRAARCLARKGSDADVPAMQVALSAETSRWVKSALRMAIASVKCESPSTPVEIGAEGEEERVMEQMHAEAVEETTQRLVHEIRPILGRLDVHAASEIADYLQSKTKSEWNRLQELLVAIDKLSQAASAPIYREFDLAELLDKIITGEKSGSGITVVCAGPKPFVILGASSLVLLVIGNAIRNAVEASASLSTKEAVVVNWGVTDRDYWISVLDHGCGLPPTVQKVFEIGTTTKKGHLGMGLALARQAALSLSGSISIAPRDQSGTRFEFRWPHAPI